MYVEFEVGGCRGRRYPSLVSLSIGGEGGHWCVYRISFGEDRKVRCVCLLSDFCVGIGR